jgi:hypothetical protein
MSSQPQDEKPQRGFFAVDRRAWAEACKLGLNAAVAYLVLARGSAADNRHTTWSVQAIESYTGISRGRAQEALRRLQHGKLIELLREGTRPKYRIVPAHEVPGCEGYPPPALDQYEQVLFAKLCAGETWTSDKGSPELGRRSARHVVKGLEVKGWARHRGNFCYAPIAYDAEHASRFDRIWLPNEIVSGAAEETPPVELLRQAQDVMLLRLFVDLYHAQNLRDEGGISRKIITQEYERKQVGQQAQFTIWGFHHTHGSVTWTGPTVCHRREKLTPEEEKEGKNPGVDYFRREQQLVNLGLLEWVPSLIESNDQDAEIIHPYGMGGSAGLEDRLGAVAHLAAQTMLTDRQQEWADEQGLRLAPVPKHITNVQLSGIARLRYRPATRKTTAWWADQQVRGEGFLSRYEALIEAASERALRSA